MGMFEEEYDFYTEEQVEVLAQKAGISTDKARSILEDMDLDDAVGALAQDAQISADEGRPVSLPLP